MNTFSPCYDKLKAIIVEARKRLDGIVVNMVVAKNAAVEMRNRSR